MLSFIIKVIYVYIIGFVLAVLEVQIEGKEGWAKTLPTWRPHIDSKLGKWFFRVTKKELTGYHIALTAFILFFLHLPFIWFWEWSWQLELEVLAFYVIFTQFWDFLWFVLNPHHSLRDFNKENIKWHRAWWGRWPADYYVLGVFGPALLMLPLIIINPVVGLMKLFILIFGIIILTAITIFLYPKAY